MDDEPHVAGLGHGYEPFVHVYAALPVLVWVEGLEGIGGEALPQALCVEGTHAVAAPMDLGVAAAVARIVVPERRRLRQMDGHRHEWNAHAPDDLDRRTQGVKLRLATGFAAQEADWFGRGDAIDV